MGSRTFTRKKHEHETHSSQIISMDRFRFRYFNDVRNGWPYDYHNTFWDNYYRKYGNQNYEYDFSIEWPFPTGPREESYLWNRSALLSPACPSCHRASVQAYMDYPRRATTWVLPGECATSTEANIRQLTTENSKRKEVS